MTVHEFVDDDPGYLRWLTAHPHGFVVNSFRTPKSSYLVLHKATCGSISRQVTRGERWTVAYGKFCSSDLDELDHWSLRTAGGDLQPCGLCRPRYQD